VTKVVVDTNLMRRGHFSATRLQTMVDSVGGEAEFVVPEVVIWEWAEHAAAAFDALRDQHKHFPVDPQLIGLPALPEPPSKKELVPIIERSLPAGVEVWKAAPQTWRDAVEAQVLQTGTGERKEGVKTGAADHLVLACVRETMHDRSNAEAVVLATGDKRLRETCAAEFGDDVLLANSHHELLKRLVEFEPAAGELAEHVEEQLAARVKHPTSDIGLALETFSMGFEVASRTEPLKPSTRELARLGRIHIFELHDLEVGQFEGGARVGYASVRLFADVHMSVLELGREDDGGLGWVQTYSGTLTDGTIDLTLNLSFDRDWNLLSVTSGGAALIDFNPSDEDENEPAAS
jgi:rRNA-processing protein FCF1